jgi:ribosome maturation factor RimP
MSSEYSHDDLPCSKNFMTVPNIANPGETPSPRYIGAVSQPAIIRVIDAVRPIVEQAGLTLIGVERAQEGKRLTLWVYIDHPDGVTSDHCGAVSPEISAVLDVVDPVSDAYDLRVSSPGIDRPLMSDVDFQQHIGRTAKIRLMSPLRGRRKFQGEILKMDEDLEVRCADGDHEIPLTLIQRARLYYTDDDLKALLRAHEGR